MNEKRVWEESILFRLTLHWNLYILYPLSQRYKPESNNRLIESCKIHMAIYEMGCPDQMK
jgi:hypothetical protein